jgi:glycosyltransferase involved in cell wall biosynthesis
MKFTIITITLNSENFIQNTLKSVEQQTFKDFEHIVWDGGSSDNTLQIVRNFPAVKILEGKDSGIADAMNKASRHAEGDFLIFLHSDDLFVANDVLSRINTYFEEHKDVNWAYGLYQTINRLGEVIDPGTYHPYSFKKLRLYNYIPHPSTVIKRCFFEQSEGYLVSLKYCMDYELWLRFSKIAPANAMPFCVSAFRSHEGSLSTSRPIDTAREAYEVRKKYAQNLWEHWRNYRRWIKTRRRYREAGY